VRVPSAPVDTTAASPTLTTSDGVRLGADLVVPAGARAGAVLLHPHPRFGGNRLNAVVAALFRSLP
jgi:alpha/beta superfamily hydrolase